jgi:hypothetical protein
MKIENMEKALDLIQRHRDLNYYSGALSKENSAIYIGTTSMSSTMLIDKTGLHKANIHSSILGELESVIKEIEEL